MKIVITVLVVLAVVLALLLIWALMSRNGGEVRRGELKRAAKALVKSERDLATLTSTMDQIEAELDNYSDIESPLAAKVRQHIRKYRTERNTPTA